LMPAVDETEGVEGPEGDENAGERETGREEA
jgi:hypothetical protein